MGNALNQGRSGGWLLSLALYAAFALAVFLVQGSRPLLGPDHVSYMELADSILEKRPGGDYWRETDSVRSFGVLLAYLYAWTGSHLLSMKLLLAALTVPFLLSAELLFGLFAKTKWQAMLFAVVSAFAVSFGFASWGVTDSTALLARTTVAPLVVLCIWFWFRYRNQSLKYLVFPALICGSLLHLSTFHLIAVFGLMELWDFVANRKLRIDSRVPAFLGSLILAAGLLYAFESLGVSVKVITGIVPRIFVAATFETPDTVATPAPAGVDAGSTASAPASEPGDGGGAARTTQSSTPSAKQAWDLELSLRPFRNMPLPLVNVANLLSSYALILLMALCGVIQARRVGFTSADRDMAALFVVIPVFSFLPQTVLWILRSFVEIFPVSMEEVRTISLVMIPSLYFILRLFQSIVEGGGAAGKVQAAAVILGTVALPLGMKSMPPAMREMILSAMTAMGVVDATNVASLSNARSALGISPGVPVYYSTERIIQWFRENTAQNSRILTDRDEFMLLRGWEVVGPRQVAAVPPRWGVELPDMSDVFLATKEAMRSRDTPRVTRLARKYAADYAVVPWPVEGARYIDDYFSVIALNGDRKN